MLAPEVSVIIPSYNHDRFIEEAIRSVLSQTNVRVELIVVDDGSSDDSVERIQRLAADDDRIRIYSQTNAGSHAAINRGLGLATAPWLSILNSDDVWEPTRLERMLAVAAQGSADFLFSDCQLIDADGAAIVDPAHWWNFSTDRLRERARAHGLVDGLLYGNLTISTSNFLFRRELLSRVGKLRRFRYNLDWDYVLRCLDADGVKVVFVDEPLLRYRLHGNNAILSGMPSSAAEAQVITRQVYRRRLRAPESLLLSHHRHDRLLRRYLQSQVRNYRQSFSVMEADRDSLAALIHQRQQIIEAERRQAEHIQASLRADMADREKIIEAERQQAEHIQAELRADMADRDQTIEAERQQAEHIQARLRADIAAREQIIEAERQQAEHIQAKLHADMAAQEEENRSTQEALRADLEVRRLQFHRQLHQAYSLGIELRAQRDRIRCREVRMLDHLEGRDVVGWRPSGKSRSLLQRIMRAARSGRRITESVAYLIGDMPPGSVRTMPREPMPVMHLEQRIAAHLHIYYRDLVPELIADALCIPDLGRIVITGPWNHEDLEASLRPAIERGIDVRVLVVPNRGKDIGGLLVAIQEGGLLDSDLVLKLHSKKSHNPDTYFQAISALFGTEIRDGDQWRRELIQPLAGSPLQVNTILKLFHDDPAIGMVGARSFITSVSDANADLTRAVFEKFGVPPGLPFVAGTMFWMRSSLLKPLLDQLTLDDFTLDSREVEGGLEHIMERLLGALVLADGFDVYGIDA